MKKLLIISIYLTLSLPAFAVWDKTKPLGSEAANLADDYIRETRTDIEAALQFGSTQYFPGNNTSSPRYIPTISTFTTALRPAGNDAPLGRLIINTSSNTFEHIKNDGSWAALDVVPSSSIESGDLAASVAGDGLAGEGSVPLRVNVDSNTFTITNDTVTIKNGGISSVMIASRAVAGEHIKSTATISDRPGFSTYLGVELVDVTGNTTSLTVPFDTEVFDRALEVSGATMTAKVTGNYQFDAAVSFYCNTSHNSGRATIKIVTTNRTYVKHLPVGTDDTEANTPITADISVLADMTAGNIAYVTIAVEGDGGGGVKDCNLLSPSGSELRTYFMGHLIF